MQSTIALEPIIFALKDSSSIIRWTAAEALGKIKHLNARKPLSDVLNDPRWLVRKYAHQALQNIKTIW
jgi:HEAT repeat protein